MILSGQNEINAFYTEMTAEKIRRLTEDTGIQNATLTGRIVDILAAAANGNFMGIHDRIIITLDYKLPGNGMEDNMRLDDNIKFLKNRIA